jgi:hypothetical protein
MMGAENGGDGSSVAKSALLAYDYFHGLSASGEH